MPIQVTHNDKAAQCDPPGREDLIEAELTTLFFKQTPLGIAGTLINAGALTLLLWQQVDKRSLTTWLAALLLISTLRAIATFKYHHHHRQHRCLVSQQILIWSRCNIIGLAVTGLLWAATMLVVFPVQSLVHQLCSAFILCGMVTASASLYAGVPMAYKAFGLAPLAALICRFLIYPDPVHLVLAGLAMLYLVIMVLTCTNLARTRRRLLSTQIELADRVNERTKALKEANTALKSEIQERRKFEESLRQERDRLETITTTIGAGLAVISKKYKTLWTNRIFRETFGEVEGQPCYKAHFQRDRVCDECGARMVFEQGYEKVIHEQQHLDAQGNPLWVQIVTTPIRNAEGHIRAALELVLPITELKLAESARRRMSEQLEEARKTEAIATLAGGIAHQFNNALAVISGNIELLEYDYRHDPQIGTYSQPVTKAADRMTQLTNQLLAYAKGGKYKERPNDLSAVTETTLALIKHTIAPEISVHQLLPSDLPKVKIDVTQIQMVISAIVANAAEAINGSGSIKISSAKITIDHDNCAQYGSIPPGCYVSLTVADDGAGMDDKTVKRIFEPFFTTKFQGRGLGMAAVYGIIRNHAGYIKVTSQTGRGTQVCIYFPALVKLHGAPSDAAGQDVQGSGTVFMIEDDPGVVEINETWLKRMGYEVLVATTAAQAIQIICRSNRHFDVVLLDLVLPDMGGAALYPLIRQHRPLAKVIVCSGYGLDGSTQELLDAGADGFIQKPYTLANIGEIIMKVMQADGTVNPDDSSGLRN